jgi:hypothetical protein
VQAFCPQCGTPNYSSVTEHPEWVSIRLGCVNQRAELRPQAQIWRRSAMPWLDELSAVPGSPEQQAILAALPMQRDSGQ